jgi:hypothetical protein
VTKEGEELTSEELAVVPFVKRGRTTLRAARPPAGTMEQRPTEDWPNYP